MSQHDIIPSSGINDLSGSINLVVKLAKAVDNVKVHQSQCRDLASRCQALRSALRDHSVGLEGTQALQVVDEVDGIIGRIHDRVVHWGEYSKMRSIIKQNEIKLGIEDSYRELEACSMQFNIALHLNARTHSKDLEAIREHDHAQLLDMMAKSLQNIHQLKAALTADTPEDVQSVMRTIQEELRDPNLEETQEHQLQQGLYELSQWTNTLPPMADLTGQVVRTSEHAVIVGGSHDIFYGEWLDAEEVALGCPRNQTPNAQKRFQQQVEIWRRLQHPNVLRLYGITYLDGYVYSVSPWMRNGNAVNYLQAHPETDRTRLLTEIASGLEYLHTNGIVHGDLRGANILISDTGKACIGDFGLSQFEDVSIDTVTGSAGNSRWLAPEMIMPEEFVSPTKAADIWSFGMTCLELYSGAPPYANIAKDVTVAIVVSKKTTPARPEDAEVTARGLNDPMWDIMQQCWRWEPETRPTMATIRATMKNLLSDRSPRTAPVAIPPRPTLSSTGHVRSSGSVSEGPRSLLTISKPPNLEVTRARTPSTSGSSTSAAVSSAYGDSDSSGAPPRSYLTAHTPVSLSSGPVTVPMHSAARSFFGKTVSSSPPSQLNLKPPPSPKPSSTVRNTVSQLSPIYQSTPLTSSHSRTNTSGSGSPHFGNEEQFPQPLVRTRSSTSRHESFASGTVDQYPPTTPTSDLESLSPRREREMSYSDYQAPPSSRLDQATLISLALRDPEALLRRSVDGTVEAGTLQGLMRRLIMTSADPMKDVDFRLVFLTTYRVYTTSDEVFGILKTRFDEANNESLTITTAPGVGTRYPILLLLKTWLKMEYEDMDFQILASIQDFARTITGSQTMEAQAREIVTIVDEQIRHMQDPARHTPLRSPTLPGVQPADPDTIKAADLAAALTIVEGDCYSRITYLDCVMQLIQSSNKHVDAASVTNNRIVNWVKKRVLKSNDVNRRAEVFKFFVNTAEECRRLGNFSSMTAIVTALQSATKADSTSPLLMTRSNKLTSNEKRTLRKLDDLLSPTFNHRAYRDALRESGSSRVVPWLAAHLHYLTTIFNRVPAAIEIDGHGLINFERYTILVSHIRAILDYKSPELPHARASGTLVYLQAELKATPSQGVHEHFEKRSAQLAAEEKIMHDQHLAELLALGFTPPRPSSSRPHTAESHTTEEHRAVMGGGAPDARRKSSRNSRSNTSEGHAGILRRLF